MAKARKLAAEPDLPRVGDKVRPGKSEMVYEISRVSPDGDEVNLHVPGTNLERFRVRTDTLSFVERMPPAKTSDPFTTPEPTFDAAEVLQHIDSVRRESLKQSDDDNEVLKNYLKATDAPNAVIEILESLTIDQHKSWKSAMDQIKKLLEK